MRILTACNPTVKDDKGNPVKDADGKVQKTGETLKLAVDYELGATLDDSIKLFGGPVVHSYFVKDGVIAVQNFVRTRLDQGKKDGEITEALKGFVLGIAKPKTKKNVVETGMDAYDRMTEEERVAFIKKISVKSKG